MLNLKYCYTILLCTFYYKPVILVQAEGPSNDITLDTIRVTFFQTLEKSSRATEDIIQLLLQAEKCQP